MCIYVYTFQPVNLLTVGVSMGLVTFLNEEAGEFWYEVRPKKLSFESVYFYLCICVCISTRAFWVNLTLTLNPTLILRCMSVLICVLQLKLTGEAATPTALPEIRAAIGSSASHPLTLSNPNLPLHVCC